MPKNVKNTTFPSFFDILAPHSCRGCDTIGSALCDRCKNYIISAQTNFCPNCKAPTKNGKCKNCKILPPTFIGGERTGLLNQLIHDFKYNSVRSLAQPLAEIMDHALPDIDGKTIIVPLPTIGKHIRARGLDHTYLIAKRLAHLHPNFSVQKLLTRANSAVQVGADHTTRINQASMAYSLAPNANIDPDTTYILLDDVWTTGASMQAAIKRLRRAGAKHIIVAILAVSRMD